MHRRDGPENLRIWPLRVVVGFWPLEAGVGIFTILQSLPVVMNWDLKHHKMRRALGWGQHRMVSIDFYELRPSPRVAMDRSQKLINLIIFTNPSARARYDTRSIFKWSLTGLNSEFSFSLTSCLTKAEEPSLPYYLPIAGGRIFGFIPFPRVLGLCEMQSVRSRIWTLVAVSISCDDNHYTTGTPLI